MDIKVRRETKTVRVAVLRNTLDVHAGDELVAIDDTCVGDSEDEAEGDPIEESEDEAPAPKKRKHEPREVKKGTGKGMGKGRRGGRAKGRGKR